MKRSKDFFVNYLSYPFEKLLWKTFYKKKNNKNKKLILKELFEFEMFANQWVRVLSRATRKTIYFTKGRGGGGRKGAGFTTVRFEI